MIKYRPWQLKATNAAVQSVQKGRRPIVHAVMGAGKSFAIGRLCSMAKGDVVVTVPTRQLVEQTAEAIRTVTGEPVGMYYTRAKHIERITVCCMASTGSIVKDEHYKKPSLWIADECHKTECDTGHAWAEAIEGAKVVGFTATPARSSHLESLQLFDEVCFEFGFGEAINAGYLVEPAVHFPLDLGAAYTECLQFIANLERDGIVGAGAINARNVKEIHKHVAFFESNGIKTYQVYSGQSQRERAENLEGFMASKGQRIMCYCNILSEGFNFPDLRYIIMWRKTTSKVRFAQEAGRVLRASEGKHHGHILDLHGLFENNGLSVPAAVGAMLWDDSKDEQERDPIKELLDESEQIDLEFTRELEELDVDPLEQCRAWLVNRSIAIQVATGEKFMSDARASMDATEKQRNFINTLRVKLRHYLIAIHKTNGEFPSWAVPLKQLLKLHDENKINRGTSSRMIQVMLFEIDRCKKARQK